MTPDRLRQAAMALAVGRTAMGVTALAAPSLIWRPWVGDTRGVPARVLGRALGGRDLALGLGTLAVLRAVPPVSAVQFAQFCLTWSLASWAEPGPAADRGLARAPVRTEEGLDMAYQGAAPGRMCWSSFPAPRTPSVLGPPPPRPGLRFAWPG
jgi:hypothetical protein